MDTTPTFENLSSKELDIYANKQAQKFMGTFAVPTLILGATVFLIYMAMIWAMISGTISLWVGFLIISFLAYAAYTVLHDAVHSSLTGKHKTLKWINNGFGYLAGQLMFVSFTAHQQEHLAHHRYTNIEGKDPDLYVESDSLWSLIKGPLVVVPLQYEYYFKYCWANAKFRDKATLITEVIVMIGWRLALFVTGFWKVGLLVIGSTFLGAFILVVLFVWIVHRPHKTSNRYENTTTFTFPKGMDLVISWLWLFQNYHSIHHLFPRVPFYKYRQLYRNIEPVMVIKNAPIVRIGQNTKR